MERPLFKFEGSERVSAGVSVFTPSFIATAVECLVVLL